MGDGAARHDSREPRREAGTTGDHLFCGVLGWGTNACTEGNKARRSITVEGDSTGAGSGITGAGKEDGVHAGTGDGRNAHDAKSAGQPRGDPAGAEEPRGEPVSGDNSVAGQLQAGLHQPGVSIGVHSGVRLADAGQEAGTGRVPGPRLSDLRPLAKQEIAFLVEQSRCIETPGVEALLAEGRIQLIEVCCSPQSGLSAAMIQKAGENSAFRMSAWNGYDLTTSKGAQKARNDRRRLRPKDMWISTPCGPWSRMQRINQRTAAQIKRLKDKRGVSLIIITNAVALAYDQAQDGGYIHWEWPRDAASHGLSVVMRMVEDLCLITVRLDGCQVGLRDDKGVLCYKPWIIYTNCPEMAKALALKCSRDHVHAHIEGNSRPERPTTQEQCATE